MVFLLVAPLVAVVVHLATSHYRRYSRQMQDSMGDVTQITNESIKGQLVIRTFNAMEFVSSRFRSASESNRRQNMKMVATESTATPLVQILVSIAMAILIWFAMSPELFASSSAGELVTFLTLAGLLAKPIRQLSGVNAIIQRGISAASSIFDLLDTPREGDGGIHTTDRATGLVEFDDVGFAYESDKPVLQGINLCAKPGMTVALVGRSGSGKSTLLAALIGALPAAFTLSGRVLLNDKDITTLPTAQRRIGDGGGPQVVRSGPAQRAGHGQADVLRAVVLQIPAQA
jgi:subfamily B ATP-binding cassette protein MsbA